VLCCFFTGLLATPQSPILNLNKHVIGFSINKLSFVSFRGSRGQKLKLRTKIGFKKEREGLAGRAPVSGEIHSIKVHKPRAVAVVADGAAPDGAFHSANERIVSVGSGRGAQGRRPPRRPQNTLKDEFLN